MNPIEKIRGLLKKREANKPEKSTDPKKPVSLRRRNLLIVIGVVVFLGASVAGWLWWSSRSKIMPPVNAAQPPAKPISAPQSQPIVSQVEASGVAASGVVASEATVSGVVVKQAESNVANSSGDTVDKTSSQKNKPENKNDKDMVAALQELALRDKESQQQETHKTRPHKMAAAGDTSSAREETVDKTVSQKNKPENKNDKDMVATLQELALRDKESQQQETHKTRPHKMAAAGDTSIAREESEPASLPVHAKHHVVAKKHPRHESLPAPSMLLDDERLPPPEGGVNKQIKPLSLQQQAENEFRRANELAQQGRIEEASLGYEVALRLDAGHEAARQALVALLLENKRNAEAELVLQAGLKHNIKHSGFAMLLARIQVDRDASWQALLTLQKTLPYAERQADYRAFVAALLQRLNRHKEAVSHYQAAVQISPNSGVWWMGMGISLQALQRNDEARAAFKHALDSRSLNADLQIFVAQQLKSLKEL